MSHKTFKRFNINLLFFLCVFALSTAYGDVNEIKATGKLRIGVCTQDQPPFYYHNDKGELVGIDINIARAVSEELGVEPEFIIDRNTWDEVIKDVASGRTDMAASYTSLTSQRSLIVSFAEPHIEVKPILAMNRLLLMKARESGLMTLRQMFANGRFQIDTPGGSSFYTLANMVFNNIGAVIYGDLDSTSMNKVLNGEVLAYFTDEVEVEDLILRHPEYKLRMVAYHLKGYTDPTAIPISYKNPILLSLVNSVLETRKMQYSTEDIIKMLKDIIESKGSK